MDRRDLYVTIFWAALGLFVAIHSATQLGLGEIHTPGPGLFPFALGGLFFLVALFKLLVMLTARRGPTTGPRERGDRLNMTRLLVAVACLSFYGLFLESVGYIVTTFLVLTVLFWNSGYRQWARAAGYAAGVVVITYLLFTYLGTRFPPGVLSYFGFY